MRAILINAKIRSVTMIDVSGFEAAKQAIGCEIAESAYRFPNGDMLLVDEEGLFKQPEDFFVVSGFDRPIAGSGIILGDGPDGEFTDARSESVQVHFLTLEHLEPWMDAEEEMVAKMRADCARDGMAFHAITMRELLSESGGV